MQKQKIHPISERRTKYLAITKQITEAVVGRNCCYQDVCPGSHRAEEKQAECLRKIVNYTTTIDSLCNRMRDVEREPGEPLGINSLFKYDPDNVIRVAVAMLLTAGCSADARQYTRQVGELLDTVGNRDPAEVIQLRNAFRADGVLRPYISIEIGVTLDESYNLCLTESAFNMLLALPVDREFEILEALRTPRGRLRV